MINLPIKQDVLMHFIINNVLMLIAVIAVALRLTARRLKRNPLGADDYFIIAAVPFAAGMLTMQGLYARLGAGYNIVDVPLGNLRMILEILIAYQLVFAVSLLMVKMSIMFFYLRVFVNPGLRMATKIVMGVVLLWSCANIIQVFLICRPFRSTYDITVTGTCGNRQGSFIAIGAFNVVTDFIILLLPVPTVWKLHMPTSAKVALTGVFSVGLLVSVIAVVRMITLAQIDFANLTGTMIYPSFWSATEPILSILSVCLPMLHPILVFLWPGRFRREISDSSSLGPSKQNQGKSFERLHDGSSSQYPLTPMYTANGNMRGQAIVSSYPDPLDTEDIPRRSLPRDSHDHLRGQGISVKKEWQVNHTS